MARKNRNPKARGWYDKAGDPPGTERFWDGEKWGPQPRVKRGAEAEVKKPSRRARDEESTAGDTEETAEQVAANSDEGLDLQQSSLWARISARSADMVVVILPWYFIWVRAFSTETSVVDGVATDTTVVDQTFIWASVAFLVIYEVAFVRWWGATPGKRLVGLLIVDRETMAPPGWLRSVVRSTPMVLVAAVVLAPLLWIVCVVAMARDKWQRSVFDFSAGTVVVMDPKRSGRLAKPKGSGATKR